jgi:DNA-binding GntR family transcriptional regulator
MTKRSSALEATLRDLEDDAPEQPAPAPAKKTRSNYFSKEDRARLLLRLKDALVPGERMSVADAVCETGGDPEVLLELFRELAAAGAAELHGGPRRGYYVIPR